MIKRSRRRLSPLTAYDSDVEYSEDVPSNRHTGYLNESEADREFGGERYEVGDKDDEEEEHDEEDGYDQGERQGEHDDDVDSEKDPEDQDEGPDMTIPPTPQYHKITSENRKSGNSSRNCGENVGKDSNTTAVSVIDNSDSDSFDPVAEEYVQGMTRWATSNQPLEGWC